MTGRSSTPAEGPRARRPGDRCSARLGRRRIVRPARDKRARLAARTRRPSAPPGRAAPRRRSAPPAAAAPRRPRRSAAARSGAGARSRSAGRAHAPPPREAHGKRRTAATRAATAPAPATGGGARRRRPPRPRRRAAAARARGRPRPRRAACARCWPRRRSCSGQGEVGDACARGEEAKRLAPKSPPVHKFLGKCYMRAGRHARGQRQLQAVSRARAQRARRALRQEHDQVSARAPGARAGRRRDRCVRRGDRLLRRRGRLRGARLHLRHRRARSALRHRPQRRADDLLPGQPARTAPTSARSRAAKPMSLARRHRCVQGDAQLAACNPADTTIARTARAGAAISAACAPTSPSDEGVCLTMQPCSHGRRLPEPGALDLRGDVPATSSTRTNPRPRTPITSTACSGTAWRAARPAAPGSRACPSWSPPAAHPPDICVPNCDSQDRCPPNHFCFRKLSGTGSPHICLPGLLGFLCESDIDCMVGKCISDNEPDEGAAPEPVHASPAATTPTARSSTAIRASSSAS